MKLGTLLVTAPLAALALAGCASTTPPAASTAKTEQQPDMQLVTAVVNQAKLNGVQVIWINLPTKAVPTGS